MDRARLVVGDLLGVHELGLDQLARRLQDRRAVTLDAGTGDDASANESVPCTLEGEDITVAFNPSYLSEGLAVVDQPQVRFAFTSAPKPALLTGVNQEDGVVSDYRYLVMPVRIA